MITKLIDSLFQSELIKKPNTLHKIITALMVIIFIYITFHLVGIKEQEENIAIQSVNSLDNNTDIVFGDSSLDYIYNNAGLVFDDNSVFYINKVNNIFYKSKFQPEIVIYTDNHEITDINSESNKIFNERGIGSTEYNTGILIYLNTSINPKLRIEVGYGLEGVLNDAKTGRIIDDNIKKINSSKELKEFNNEELSKLVTNIFNDIAVIIAETYKIDLSISIKSLGILDKIKANFNIYYKVILKENTGYYPYLFIVMLILLYFRALKYKYVYAIFIGLIVAGYLMYAFLNGSIITLILFLLFLPLIIVALPQDIYSKCTDDNMTQMYVYKMPKLMVFLRSIYYAPAGDSFSEINYKFLLNNFVVYYTLYLFLLLMFQKYVFDNILLIAVFGALILISIILMIKQINYRMIIPYSVYTAIFTLLMVSDNVIYSNYLLIIGIILVIYNLFVGYNIVNIFHGLDIDSLAGILDLLLDIIHIILYIITVGRIGGGRSGGGGASR